MQFNSSASEISFVLWILLKGFEVEVLLKVYYCDRVCLIWLGIGWM